MQAQRLFRSGDLVIESGVYAVLHSTPHSLIEHETHIQGARFGRCKFCPLGVWYRLEASCLTESEEAWWGAAVA
jgi:hypothetical protein